MVADDLRALVGPDPVQRTHAAERLGSVSPFVCTEIVAGDDFPTRTWLDDLIDCLLALTLRPDEDHLDAEGRMLQRIAADRIFEALSEPLALVPERLAELLAHARHRPRALRACTRLGGRALPLLPLVDDTTALEVLRHVGPAARDFAPRCVAALERPALRVSAIRALGAVTAGTDVAVDRLLALADSADMVTREACVAALGEIGVRPEAVVPRLIAALDECPDAACAALARFGPAAAPATAALVARLVRPEAPGEAGGWDDRAGPAQYERLDDGALRALAAIGPAASAALPELERLRQRGHPVDGAIARIGGRT